MKALSIKQPWLHFILQGWKTLEIRTWKSAYRGPLLLVASATVDRNWDDVITDVAYGTRIAGKYSKLATELLYGQALCIVDMVDCRPMEKSDEAAAMCYWSPPVVKSSMDMKKPLYTQLYAWEFKKVQTITPFPVKGRLSFYDVELPKGNQ